jgi:hypothetical protein
VGWEARKTPAEGDVFFLDFPLYRTSQDLAPLEKMIICFAYYGFLDSQR